MKEETLTAKEWLDVNMHLFTKGNRDNIWIDSMEKYANYKSGVLEDRIKEFRRLLKEELSVGCNGSIDIFYIFDKNDTWHYHAIEEVYDKHFNIENKQ